MLTFLTYSTMMFLTYILLYENDVFKNKNYAP